MILVQSPCDAQGGPSRQHCRVGNALLLRGQTLSSNVQDQQSSQSWSRVQPAC